MTNAEWFKDEMLKLAKENKPFGISKKNGHIMPCEMHNCQKCVFGAANCVSKMILWLFDEHKTSIILTPFQRQILERLHYNGAEYIARNEEAELLAFTAKPLRVENAWRLAYGDYYEITPLFDDFTFAKRSDKEPYSIEALLKEVEE